MLALVLAPPVAAAAPAGPATLPTGEDAVPLGMGLAAPAALPPAPAYVDSSLAPDLPLQVPLSSPFGWRADPMGAGGRFHAGVDLPAPAGSPARATRAGTVVFAGWAGGYGNMVAIDHGGGWRTRYAHLARLLVYAGEFVAAGAVVGTIGSTGRSTGPHLHYELRLHGAALDPLLRVAQSLPDDPWPDFPARPAATARWDWAQAASGPALPMPVLR